MGLNIYFCDVCGVRVTDVDLRSGHGMLRGRDVICATCLEMGHGKEWLSSRGMPAEAATGIAGSAEGGGSAPRRSVAGLLDGARDRAATVKDDEPVTAVRQSRSLASDSARRASLDLEDTNAVPEVREADFAGAAAGLAALGHAPAPRHSAKDGDLDEESSDDVDATLLPSPVSGTDTDGVALSAIDADTVPTHVPSTGGRPMSDSARSGPAAAAKDRSRSGKSSARSATGKSASSAAQSSSRSGRVAKSQKTSARSSKRSAVDGGMPVAVKISLITVPLILVLTLAVLFGRGGGSGEPDVKDLPAQKERVIKGFNEVRTQINDAYASKDVAKMKAANTRWQQFLGEWDRFASDAKTYSGWTETNCNDYWDSLKAADVGARTKLLRDEISKQAGGAH